jgi:acetoin:2,6-dichlorophenolindophenol oxidoreductase subunit alpha
MTGLASVVDASAHRIGLDLYRRLFLCRRAEERIIDLYPENDMKTPMHMSFGQEAIPAAVAQALGERADMVTTYRSHAPFLAITGNIDAFYAELYGRVAGYAEGKGGSMHLALPDRGHLYSTAIVGGGLSIAVGAAFANLRLRNGRIAGAFFGDGALEEGSFWESMNVASVMKLPMLFICEDNGLAVHTRQPTRHGFRSLAEVVECMAGWRYLFDESNDAESIHAKCVEAIEHIDSGAGPAFLHAKCFRYLEHVGIGKDFHEGYRSIDEMTPWAARDSIKMQRARLVAEGLEREVAAIEAETNARIESAIAKAKASPSPGPERLNVGVFHETH